MSASRQAHVGKLPDERVLYHSGKGKDDNKEKNPQQDEGNDNVGPADVVLEMAEIQILFALHLGSGGDRVEVKAVCASQLPGCGQSTSSGDHVICL